MPSVAIGCRLGELFPDCGRLPAPVGKSSDYMGIEVPTAAGHDLGSYFLDRPCLKEKAFPIKQSINVPTLRVPVTIQNQAGSLSERNGSAVSN